MRTNTQTRYRHTNGEYSLDTSVDMHKITAINAALSTDIPNPVNISIKAQPNSVTVNETTDFILRFIRRFV